MSKLIRSVLAATGVATVLMAALASPAAAGEGGGLAAVRKATARFHHVEKATQTGYQSFLPCFDLPGVGGMGQHFVNFSLVNGSVTPTQPQALVYEVDGDELNLVAVEYIIPYSLVPANAEPPRLFGQTFHKNNMLSLWALHAWIWRHNPLGMFADYNPRVALCPRNGESD